VERFGDLVDEGGFGFVGMDAEDFGVQVWRASCKWRLVVFYRL
jgi:hypothetical protein